jgi:tetratricopeptide (TPR) repeat protein
MQGYSMAPDDLRMIVRTFRTAFPAATTWSAAPGDFLLVGGVAPQPFPHVRVAERYTDNPGVREDFARAGLPAGVALLADFMLGADDTARFAGDAPRNTDDRLPLEFSAARSLYRNTAAANWLLIRGFRTQELAPVPDTAETRHSIGMAYVAKHLPEPALEEFDRALRTNPGYVPSLLARGRLLRSRGDVAGAIEAFETALRREPGRADAHFEIGVARQMGDGPPAALSAYRRAVELAPERADYMRAYATALAQGGRLTEAVSYLLLARAFRPRDPALMDLTAFMYVQAGNTSRAVELLQQAVAVAPGEAIYHFRLGQVQMQAKNAAAAIASLERAAELHLELANTYMIQQQVGPAIRAYRRVLALDPNNTMATRVLSTLLR